MTEDEIAAFRARLEQMLRDLQEETQRGAQGTETVMLDQQSVGRLSRMDALQQQAMAKAAQTRRAGQAARIRAALARIEEGEFGYCTDCGEVIAPGRLDLDPTTPTCITCAR